MRRIDNILKELVYAKLSGVRPVTQSQLNGQDTTTKTALRSPPLPAGHVARRITILTRLCVERCRLFIDYVLVSPIRWFLQQITENFVRKHCKKFFIQKNICRLFKSFFSDSKNTPCPYYARLKTLNLFKIPSTFSFRGFLEDLRVIATDLLMWEARCKDTS